MRRFSLLHQPQRLLRVLVLVSLLLPACQTLPSPEPLPALPDLSSPGARSEYVSRHPELEERIRQRIESGDLAPGMSVSELREQLGDPHETVRRDADEYDETWSYHGYAVGIVFFLSDGRLVSWRERSYRNPFSPQSEVAVPLPRAQEVDVVVYDLQGTAVDTLAHGELPSGYNRLKWNPGRTGTGDPLPEGVYLARVAMADTTYFRKLVLVR